MRKLIVCAALFACASQGVPPGGPPDSQAPVLVFVRPDSGVKGVKNGSAVFQFDEVVTERPPGVTNLGDLFVVSPRQGVPVVTWHREAIQVKPRRGWLPNTTYTVTMLPGIADLRGNVKNTGASTFFSTGASLDTAAIAGSVYDLLSGSAASGAVIEARAGADTTVSWITRADSAGVFRLDHLPAKSFVVRAYLDKNRNFGADPDEPIDTITVSAPAGARDFFIVLRDSVAPRLISAVAVDSMTLDASFDKPSDSASATSAASYTVIGADSSVIPILSVKSAPRDSLKKRPPPNRVMPVAAVRIALSKPIPAKGQYKLRAVGVRGLLGQTLPSETPITRFVPADSTRRPGPVPTLPGGAVPIPIKK